MSQWDFMKCNLNHIINVTNSQNYFFNIAATGPVLCYFNVIWNTKYDYCHAAPTKL